MRRGRAHHVSLALIMRPLLLQITERIPDLMCGIIGYVGPQGTDVTSILLDSLGKLEYRGYDSAGIAVLTSTGTLELRRRAGKIANLVDSVENGSRPEQGTLGIGHT